MISRVLENQQILAQRLSLNDTQPMLEPAGIEESESSPTSSQRAKQSEDDTIIKRFAFQEDLESSRVYIRSSWKEDESFSINSQSLTTTVRSLMSDVSLEDISNISVVALPIYAEDLSNKQDYDFKNAIKSRSPKTAQRKNERGAISDGTTLIATMEYNIEDLGIKIKTSGHGLVAELMARNLSQQDLIWVVPCVGDIEYPIDQPSEPMTVRIGQRIVHVSVHYYKANSITWVLLDSPIFRMCTKSEPYPDMFDESALAKRLYGPKDADLVTTEYYSTWNQCIAQIIKRLSPVCYLIMDHRAALAPLYLLPKTIACILIYNRAQQTASTSHPVSQLPPPYSGAIYSRLTLYSPSTL